MSAAVAQFEIEAIARSTDLHALEQIIQRGRTTFLEVGAALLRIREARLYRATHSTWEAYCDQRWGWTGRRANQLVQAAEVAAEVGTVVPIESERVARELARAPVEERQAVLFEAHAAAGGAPLTGAQVRAVLERHGHADGKLTAPRLQTRRTPRWLFDFLSELFGPFTCDVAADEHNALCEEHITAEQDALVVPWADRNWCNPPFRHTGRFVARAVEQAESGKMTCMLVPVGCAQAWHHEFARRFTIYHPDRRISYDLPDGTPTGEDGGHGADRDTAILLIGPGFENERYSVGEFRIVQLALPEVP